MNSDQIKPWIEVVSLHPDVLSDDFSEDILALDAIPEGKELPRPGQAHISVFDG